MLSRLSDYEILPVSVHADDGCQGLPQAAPSIFANWHNQNLPETSLQLLAAAAAVDWQSPLG